MQASLVIMSLRSPTSLVSLRGPRNKLSRCRQRFRQQRFKLVYKLFPCKRLGQEANVRSITMPALSNISRATQAGCPEMIRTGIRRSFGCARISRKEFTAAQAVRRPGLA